MNSEIDSDEVFERFAVRREDGRLAADILVDKIERIFGPRADAWRITPMAEFDGKTPNDLLTTAEGREALFQILGRKAYGGAV